MDGWINDCMYGCIDACMYVGAYIPVEEGEPQSPREWLLTNVTGGAGLRRRDRVDDLGWIMDGGRSGPVLLDASLFCLAAIAADFFSFIPPTKQ